MACMNELCLDGFPRKQALQASRVAPQSTAVGRETGNVQKGMRNLDVMQFEAI